jgi:hypothetical protein
MAMADVNDEVVDTPSGEETSDEAVDIPTNGETSDEKTDTPTDIPATPTTPDYTDAEREKYKILRNVYMKLDGLPLSFGIPKYDEDIPDQMVERYFRIDLSDTIRETRIKIESIEPDSVDELQFENRIVYHALKRFRLTASVFFKFSTAVDGKTIDKTQIPKMLATIISEYDAEYKKWRLGHVGNLWNRGE